MVARPEGRARRRKGPGRRPPVPSANAAAVVEEVGFAAPPALFDGRVGLFGGFRGFDLFLANRAFRLAFGLEGFPDDRRLGIAARPAAIDAAAGSAVDAQHADILRRGEGHRLAVGERTEEELLVDRRGAAADRKNTRVN